MVTAIQPPAVRAIEQLAAVLLGRPVDHLEHDQWFDTETRPVQAIDGGTVDLRTPRHPDPGVDAVLRTITSEQRQAAARGRPADIGPDRRQLIVTVGDGSFDGPMPDAVVGLQALQLGRFEAGLDLGVLAENPEVMGRIAGWSEAEITNARTNGCDGLRLIKTAADGVVSSCSNFPLIGLLREVTATATPDRTGWFALQVQQAGPRQRPSRVWVLASSPPPPSNALPPPASSW